LDFKEKLKIYRKENNLTQKQLADKLGTSRSTIAETERGNIKGTIEFINKLSKVSNLPITYWAKDGSDISYESYQALDVLINAMIENGLIKDDGKIPDKDKDIVISVLEQEIKLKIKCLKEKNCKE
jgi:transcriptional regulator with XRE-family HTH domain